MEKRLRFVKDILVENKWFFLAYSIAFLTGIIVINLLPKGDTVLWINSWHNPFLDEVFRYSTQLAEGIFITLMLLVLAWHRVGYVLLLGLAQAVNLVLIAFFKTQVFPEQMRPSFLFKQLPDMNYVDGVELHYSYSFPSGHTSSVFVTFFILSLIIKRPLLQIACLILAVMGGFSRMYLVLHFLRDVLAGSLLGLSVVVLVLFLIGEHLLHSKHSMLSFGLKKWLLNKQA